MTKLNPGSSRSASAPQASIHTRERSHSNGNNRTLEICVSLWKQGSSSNPNRDKNALFAILPVLVFVALCGFLAACAGTSSTPATAPVITAQPANATVTVGQPATFTVAAAGTSPLSYQWTKNGMSVGTNSATYTTAATASSDNGAKIQVMVSNSKGSAPSSVATLMVDAAPTKPSITTQPANATVTVGQTAIFTVAATGTAPLSYQWTKNGTNIGTNSATYTTAATALTDNGAKIQVTVSNAEGSAPSSIATLTVDAAATKPSISTQPANVTVTVGQTVTFTVVATGTAPLTYQWTKNGMNVGTNSATYTTAATTSADNGTQVQVTVSNSAGSTPSSIATLTVNVAATKPAISTQPANVTVTVGQTATFTAVATGTAPLTYQWTKSGTNVGTNSATYTSAATTSSDNGAQIQVTVSNSAGSTPSNMVTLTVTSTLPPPSSVNVLTYHNDVGRTGQNLNETILTHSNVNSTSFGKKSFLTTDGLVDAEPLYVSSLQIGGAAHNVVFVVTEHNSVYAFDADTFTQLWKVSMTPSGETSSDAVNGCGQVSPEIGITSTPVIDLKAGPNGTIYLVAMTKSGSTYFHRLHALDLTTGADLAGSPVTIQASFPAAGGTITFVPKQYKERAALLLLNGVIYTSWASHCDIDPYSGWLMGYSQSSLQQTSVLNITPNGVRAAIWMAGAGLAADSTGNIYFLAGNGTFDDTLNSSGFPENGDYGNGFIKLSTTGNTLAVADYFNMFNTDSESGTDTDLGSGGAMVLPDLQDSVQNTWHLAVGAGKDTNMYIVNRDMMGKFNVQNDSAIYQQLSGVLPGGVWAMPAYFNGTIYYGSVGASLQAFPITNAKVAAASSSSSASFGYPGSTPSVSANGTSNGIVWAVQSGGPAALHAYDASNLATELYNSSQAAGGRDNFAGNKFITPMIANGKVFVGTPTGVIVFGELP
jgi:plastocyanin